MCKCYAKGHQNVTDTFYDGYIAPQVDGGNSRTSILHIMCNRDACLLLGAGRECCGLLRFQWDFR